MVEAVARRLEEIVRLRMEEIPVVLVQGPRSVGKTTLLRSLAASFAVEMIDLDDPATRSAAELDPRILVSGPRPVLIDEYQHVPAVLATIKNQLNRDGSPGQFVLTGSTVSDAARPDLSRFLTGRLYRLPLYPFSQGEQEAVRENLVDRLFEAPESLHDGYRSPMARAHYISRVVEGGFPPTRTMATAARERWFDHYIELCLERISDELSRIRDMAGLRRLFHRLASQTGQLLNMTSAGAAAGLKQKTAHNYSGLLEASFLIHRLPAWESTLRPRTTRLPKLHVVDSGIAARLLGLSADRLALRDATALQQFGHLLETFTVGEILKQVSWMDHTPTVGHWRTRSGLEVDLVVERPDGSVVAFEVKAADGWHPRSGRGLRALRDALGDRFKAGVALHTGEWTTRPQDRILAMPIDRLWRTVPDKGN